MGHRGFIVVIGTSAGGVAALTEFVSQLDKEMDAAFFIVMHLSTTALSDFLVQRLQPATNLKCLVAKDAMAIENGHIYIAPPNQHLVVTNNQIVVGYGPRENSWRPSIDVLFRSAAAAYNSSVIGIILTGFLNDGTSGMMAVKRSGGIALVQDPNEAEVPDMPLSVLNNMEVDHCVGLSRMGETLRTVMAQKPEPVEPPTEILAEAELASRMAVGIDNVSRLGNRSVFSCPDCGGGLWKVEDAGLTRYRCYTGHSYNEAELLMKQGEGVEATLWVAVRMMEERTTLYMKIAKEQQKRGIQRIAASYQQHAGELKYHIDTLKKILIQIQQSRSAN
jgi:two-component system, chemotaxis family, protein-glutamate methylesterase/glutaminase